MQVHEITQLNEQGILQGIKGAAQGFQQARQQRMTQQSMDAVIKKALPAWNKYTQQLKAATPDPQRYQQLYKQALTAFVQKNLMAGQSLDSAINRQEILQAIEDISAGADNPQQVNQGFRTLIQQAAISQPDVGKTSTLVRVINADPAVLQYRNRDYIINDQGEWADKQTGRVADQSFQAFLDQELAKVTPTASKQTAPKQSTKTDQAQLTQATDVDTALKTAGLDPDKLSLLQKLIQTNPDLANSLKKLLGL